MHRSLFVISLLGLFVSGYLLFAHISDVPIVCNAGHGCDVVRASSYSVLLGIPTPAYGVVYYTLLGVGASLWTPRRPRLSSTLVVLTGIGLVISAWLTSIEAFVINAWCIWCVTSALLALAAFAILVTQRRLS